MADTVEAMASHRPYRAALGIEAALEEIRKHKGVHYDEAVPGANVLVIPTWLAVRRTRSRPASVINPIRY